MAASTQAAPVKRKPPAAGMGFADPAAAGRLGMQARWSQASRDLAAAARDLTPAALETVAGILVNPLESARDRLRAAEIVLERGWGRPMQSIDLSVSKVGTGGGPVITLEQAALAAAEWSRSFLAPPDQQCAAEQDSGQDDD